jgi:hypothetical protein
MRYETTGQSMLFRDSCTDAKAKGTNSIPSPESSAPALSPEAVRGPHSQETSPSRTVSPLAHLSLKETCGYCGREVHPPGCVIPDYEELGAFCNQDCADRRFRMYLEEAEDT